MNKKALLNDFFTNQETGAFEVDHLFHAAPQGLGADENPSISLICTLLPMWQALYSHQTLYFPPWHLVFRRDKSFSKMRVSLCVLCTYKSHIQDEASTTGKRLHERSEYKTTDSHTVNSTHVFTFFCPEQTIISTIFEKLSQEYREHKNTGGNMPLTHASLAMWIIRVWSVINSCQGNTRLLAYVICK